MYYVEELFLPSHNISHLRFVYDYKEMINCVDFNGKISIIY